jgi:hypothetical protein
MALKLENRSLFIFTVSVLLSLIKFYTVLYLSNVTQGFRITLKLKCTLNNLACLLACLQSTLPLERPLVVYQLNKLSIFYNI